MFVYPWLNEAPCKLCTLWLFPFPSPAIFAKPLVYNYMCGTWRKKYIAAVCVAMQYKRG